MADQTVRLEDTNSEAKVAFDMAQWLWMHLNDKSPKNRQQAEQFLALVGECRQAIKGRVEFDLSRVFG